MGPFAQPSRAERSLERLYRRHAGDVYRYAYALLQNRPDAEDVTQTTFLNAYRALERGDRPDRAHNWLITIAHNVCRQRFRQSQRRPSEVAWNDDVAETLVSDESTPSGEDIRRALAHLPFNQRAAIVMRELEGRSYVEIADVLELSASAVETLIFRARRALREQLEGSLTCGEAELAISRQLDGRLSRAERGQLRAHLRECAECATFARRQRAQRSALKTLGSIPLPPSLAALFGGGGATATAVAGKTVAIVAAAAFAGGAGYEAVRHVVVSRTPAKVAAPSVEAPAPVHVSVALPHVGLVRPAVVGHAAGRGLGGGAPGRAAGHLKRLRGASPGLAPAQRGWSRHGRRGSVGGSATASANGTSAHGAASVGSHARGRGHGKSRRADAVPRAGRAPPHSSHTTHPSSPAHDGATPAPSQPSGSGNPDPPATGLGHRALPSPTVPVTVPAAPQPRSPPGHRYQGASFPG